MILLIDDDPFVRLNIEEYFQDEGIPVYSVESGEEALAWVACGGKAETAIVDIRLPGMDGSRVIEFLLGHFPHMRIVVHTGSTEYHLSPSLLALGLKAEDIVRKPVADMRILVEKLMDHSLVFEE